MLNRVMTSPSIMPCVTMPETVATPRAILRKIKLTDAAAMSAHVSDYDIAKMTGTIPFPMPKVSAEIWMLLNRSAWDRGLRFNYAICPHGTDELRGVMGFFKLSSGEWELGYWVARTLWGQGYATECADAALDAFEAANGPRTLEAGVFDDNPASIRVLSKLGFKPTGERDNPFSMARLERASGARFIREPSYAL